MTDPAARSAPRATTSRARVVWIILAVALALSLTMTVLANTREGRVHWTSTLNMGAMLLVALANVVPRARKGVRIALGGAALALVIGALVLFLRR